MAYGDVVTYEGGTDWQCGIELTQKTIWEFGLAGVRLPLGELGISMNGCLSCKAISSFEE